MNGVSLSTGSRTQLVKAALCAALFFTAAIGDAAEYSEVDDIPSVTTLLFTESSIALTVSRDASGYFAANLTTYFVADRESYSFQEISEREFLSLTSDENEADLEIGRSFTDDCDNKEYRHDAVDPDMRGRVVLQLPSSSIEVEILCWSSISTAVSVDDTIWVGTYSVGDHGVYGSEGVLVVPKNGGPDRVQLYGSY